MRIGRLLGETWLRDIILLILGGLLTMGGTAVRDWATAHDQQSTLRELIRLELAQNTISLRRGNTNLRKAATDLEAFLAGESPAPTIAAGYLGLATLGLGSQLSSVPGITPLDSIGYGGLH